MADNAFPGSLVPVGATVTELAAHDLRWLNTELNITRTVLENCHRLGQPAPHPVVHTHHVLITAIALKEGTR